MISGSYLDPAPGTWVHDRGGVRLTFHSEHRPLEATSTAADPLPADLRQALETITRAN